MSDNSRHKLDSLPDLLTVREYASWARRSLNGAYSDIAAGLVPVIRFGPTGRVLRIPKAALERICADPVKDKAMA